MNTDMHPGVNYQALADLAGYNLLTGVSIFAVKVNNVSKLIVSSKVGAQKVLLDLSPSVTQILNIPASSLPIPEDHSKFAVHDGFATTVTGSKAYVDVKVPLYTVTVTQKNALTPEQQTLQAQIRQLEDLLQRLQQQVGIQGSWK